MVTAHGFKEGAKMARHITKRGPTLDNGQAKPETAAPRFIPPVAGGSSGAPPDPNPKRTRVGVGLADIVPAPDRSSDERASCPPPKRYRVVGGPDKVMYAGVQTIVRPGKIYTEGSVDLDFLRGQGVVLEEMTAA
jgi:hypothetical protein